MIPIRSGDLAADYMAMVDCMARELQERHPDRKTAMTVAAHINRQTFTTIELERLLAAALVRIGELLPPF